MSQLDFKDCKEKKLSLMISFNKLAVLFSQSSGSDCIIHHLSFLCGSNVLRLEVVQRSLHDVKMNAKLAFCSCYDICVSVSASYNQWQEYICGKNISKNAKMIKVHLILVFFLCVFKFLVSPNINGSINTKLTPLNSYSLLIGSIGFVLL